LSADFRIQAYVVDHCGARVGKFFHHNQLVVVDSDDWWSVSILSHDIGFPQAEGKVKILAGLGEVVHEALELFISVSHHSSVIS
ncbi:hypothetical protein SK128_004913, partial [Halocaridina rubra]